MPYFASAASRRGDRPVFQCVLERSDSRGDLEPGPRIGLDDIRRRPTGVTRSGDALNCDERRHAHLHARTGRDLSERAGGGAYGVSEGGAGRGDEGAVAHPVRDGEHGRSDLFGSDGLARSHADQPRTVAAGLVRRAANTAPDAFTA
jgi:hypothetical protein